MVTCGEICVKLIFESSSNLPLSNALMNETESVNNKCENRARRHAIIKRLIATVLASGVMLANSTGAVAASVVDTDPVKSNLGTAKSNLGIPLNNDIGARPEATQAHPAWSEHAMPAILDENRFTGHLDDETLQQLVSHGELLFDARFTHLDGAGRPMATQAIIPTKRKRAPRTEFSRTAGLDANACSSCHHVPLMGGAGDFSVNVFVSEGFTNSDFDTTDPQFSNERNTNHLFGAGLLELLAREMSRDLTALRTQALRTARRTQETVEQALHSKGVSFGSLSALPDGTVDTRDVRGVDQDLIIRPFSHKGVMSSLRQFTVNALNHHHGMQAAERFGARWTDETDFDEDGHEQEISQLDVSALVAWQATLAPPLAQQPDDVRWQKAAADGKALFDSTGCTECHKPYLTLNSLVFEDPGDMDAAGTLRKHEIDGLSYSLALRQWANSLERDEHGRYKIPLFGDLKRHVIADQQVAALGNELLSQRFVERNVFMTSELWGVGSTAPYGHRGDMGTLSEVIDAHGGQARASRDAWQTLAPMQQQAIIAYLKTLTIKAPTTKPIIKPTFNDNSSSTR